MSKTKPTLGELLQKKLGTLPESSKNKQTIPEERVRAMFTTEDLADCIETFEQTQERLESIEKALGASLGISGDIRKELIALDMAHSLESELAEDWRQAYCAYLNFETKDT